MALSSAPFFLAKLPVWFMSGKLLQKYCPEHLGDGCARHTQFVGKAVATMWTYNL